MDAWSPILSFALAALATWRVTHLLAEEDGPFDSMLKLRARLGTSTAGKLMDCFQCLSLWIAAPFTFVMTHSIGMWVLVWLALSGAACLLDRVGHDAAELQFRAPDFPGTTTMTCCGQGRTTLRATQSVTPKLPGARLTATATFEHVIAPAATRRPPAMVRYVG